MYLLAQLSDLFSQRAWYVIFAVCAVAPMVGYCIGCLNPEKSPRRSTVMQVYYALFVALFVAVYWWPTSQAAGLASTLGSAGRFESSSAPKLSLCADRWGRAGFGCAACDDALAAASDVTLNTVGCPSSRTGPGAARTGPSQAKRKFIAKSIS